MCFSRTCCCGWLMRMVPRSNAKYFKFTIENRLNNILTLLCFRFAIHRHCPTISHCNYVRGNTALYRIGNSLGASLRNINIIISSINHSHCSNWITVSSNSISSCFQFNFSGEFHLGYKKSDVQGISWYQLLHWDSTKEAQSKHRLSEYGKSKHNPFSLHHLVTGISLN